MYLDLFMIIAVPLLIVLILIYEGITLRGGKLFNNITYVLIVLMAVIGVVLEVKTYI